VAGCVFAKVSLDGRAADWQRQQDALEGRAKQADEWKAKAANVTTQNAELKSKADFVQAAQKHTLSAYTSVFENVRNYTINRVVYSGVAPANQQVNITAFSPTLADVGHYMLAMEKNPEIGQLTIGMNSIPSFPATGQAPIAQAGRPSGHDFTATLTLKTPIPAAPAFPPGSAGQAPAMQMTMGGAGAGGPGGGGPGGSAGMAQMMGAMRGGATAPPTGGPAGR
jgi:hypothetical protein